MLDSTPHDMNCVPYKRKKIYFLLNIPLLLILIWIDIYLFSISFLWGIAYLGFYIGTCIFQSYCCHYQECPYVGGFCPAVAGIMPASIIANLPIIRKRKRSAKRFDLSATVGFLCLMSLIFFPLPFLLELGILFPILFLAICCLYAVLFLWQICPVCAIRTTCPGGRFSQKLFGKS